MSGPGNINADPTHILTRADIAALMTVDDHLAAAEDAFAATVEGRADVPPPLHLRADGGTFHAKGATLRVRDGRLFAAVKVNANFPQNKRRHALPTIQGAVLLFDAADGRLLAVLDSIEITIQRTAAAAALAARRLARRGASVATIVGCGGQAFAQAAFLTHVLPLTRIHAVDIDKAAAAAFAARTAKALDVDVRPAHDLAAATGAADIIVTCTTASVPFLRLSDVQPGTFIAAVGADSSAKSELFPDLLAAATLVVDSLEQCSAMGDLRHAIAAGAMTMTQVHATLGELVTNRKLGRKADHEIVVFDSTGIAAQDVAAAIRIFERAQVYPGQSHGVRPGARQLGLTCCLGASQ